MRSLFCRSVYRSSCRSTRARAGGRGHARRLASTPPRTTMAASAKHPLAAEIPRAPALAQRGQFSGIAASVLPERSCGEVGSRPCASSWPAPIPPPRAAWPPQSLSDRVLCGSARILTRCCCRIAARPPARRRRPRKRQAARSSWCSCPDDWRPWQSLRSPPQRGQATKKPSNRLDCWAQYGGGGGNRTRVRKCSTR